MLEYFDGNYAWNMGVATLVEDVGTLAEPFEAFAAIRHLSGADSKVANEAWFDAFFKLGEKFERLGDRDLAEGNERTAARKYHRAAMYFTRADRMMSHHDQRKFIAYDRVVVNFRRARDYGREGVEFIDIPYKTGAMPALLIKAPDVDGKPAPIVIQIQGYDSVKETQWPVLQTYRARGVSLMIVEQGGSGGALRLHGLIGEPEAENYVSKIVDYIMARPDIATDKIGLCGISMGGYFAPRATVYEPRIKACALWGAIQYEPLNFDAYAADEDNHSLPDAVSHGLWAWGFTDKRELFKALENICLRGVIEKIKVPLFIIHGENDRQIGVNEAIAAFEAATTPNKKLKIFKREEEGGVEHCQIDARAYAADTLADWFADVFQTAK